MQPKHRDQFRRLAIFDREGEAITTVLLSNRAITAGYRERGITVSVQGDSSVVFTLTFEHLVFDLDRDTFKEYPQILLSVAYGNVAIIEQLDFRAIEQMLNAYLPEGRRDFQMHYFSGSYSRNDRPQYKKSLF